MVSLWRLS
ncbi:hypothetical protein YPPY08_4109, partial [Yersinia pestis PY-08]